MPSPWPGPPAAAPFTCAHCATLISSQAQIEALDRVFGAMFGSSARRSRGYSSQRAAEAPEPPRPSPGDILNPAARAARMHVAQERPAEQSELPEAEQVIAEGKDEDLEPGPEETRTSPAGDRQRHGTARGQGLRRAVSGRAADAVRAHAQASPWRCPCAGPRRPTTAHGGRTDLRATLRHARRTGGHPVRLARRAPLKEPRRLVVLCDISGSMEPYARAMLQLLYCAAGGADAEVFTFATRLTRLTGTLAHNRPALALQQAGQAAPDWLGGTEIGESIKEFNNKATGAGAWPAAQSSSSSPTAGTPATRRSWAGRWSACSGWPTGCRMGEPADAEPRIPRIASGMAAAWPYCDAVVSTHTLHALDDLTAALAHPGRRRAASSS